jgi:hypothetical protein
MGCWVIMYGRGLTVTVRTTLVASIAIKNVKRSKDASSMISGTSISPVVVAQRELGCLALSDLQAAAREFLLICPS